ncbi:PfkB family carbohydrate kinase [Rhodoferax sp. GW822-FHT02A01]|uniref:PfkB family carbohydrate kinase n=1 Tax=Rhodoferax sp. GW822-FHT02A01 TaxID=3141537 RepID=UPI00315D2860
MQIQVATAGEALIDMIRNPDGRYEPCLGGAVYNLTRALARQSIETLYLNPLSRDRFGRQLAEGLLADGVHLARPEPVVEVTSLAVVSVDDAGHPDYAFYREGVADRATDAVRLTQACEAAPALQVVCTGALALSPDDAGIYLPWLAGQRDSGKVVVIDANLRPSVMPDLPRYRAHVLNTLQYADVIKVSDEDLDNLGMAGATALDQARNLLGQCDARVIALTRGGAGANLLTRADAVFHARESAPLAVVDTVGAGDCFLAGLVTAMLEAGLAADWGSAEVNASVAQRLLQNAIASASICVQRRGCVPPSRQEVLAHVASGRIASGTGTGEPQ